jgi:hypothetical protein
VSFGGVWTAVIVAQIALTVALPSVVVLLHSELKRYESYDFGIRPEDYLGVTVGVDGPPAETMDSSMIGAQRGRYHAALEVLRRRLEGEPEIAGATIVDRLPGSRHIPRWVRLAARPNDDWTRVVTASVHPSYFDVMEAPVKLGRAFNNADATASSRVVIVDQGFVDLVMQGRNPVGHHLRIGTAVQVDSTPSEVPSYEIIGVVKELGLASAAARLRQAGLYLALVPGSRADLKVMVRGRVDPLKVAPRIRGVATSVDPILRIEEMARVDAVVEKEVWMFNIWMRIAGGLTAVALLLSLSGIYAVLSYTVARRTREIGVRVALGASARLVITSIFRRPLTQVVLGVIAGSGLIAVAALVLQRTTEFQALGRRGLIVGEIAALIAYAIVMIGVCMLACVVPTARALRVQPTEALRAE